MKLYAPLFAILLAAPVYAQTEAPEGSGETMVDTNELSARVGTTFYSDEGMMTLRSAEEVQTGWSSLSAEDQEALRAQCANLPTDGAQTEDTSMPADTTSEPALPETEGAETAETSEPATGSAPALPETEGAETAETSAPAPTNFIADVARLQPVCDMIETF